MGLDQVVACEGREQAERIKRIVLEMARRAELRRIQVSKSALIDPGSVESYLRGRAL